jgi:hypothetical protein
MRISKFFILVSLASAPANAIFIDGEGHYGARGVTRTDETFGASSSNFHQAIEQDFRFDVELRSNDKASFFGEVRLFEDPFASYAGDQGQPWSCVTDSEGTPGGSKEECANQHQNTTEVGYSHLVPWLTTAYGQYATDFCIVQIGRRPRHWGLGMYWNNGDQPFSRSVTAFDGISCDVNMQRNQTLGFSFGYDKLAESGQSIDPSNDTPPNSATDLDDLDQYYVTIEFDNRKANSGASLTRNIGIMYSNILSKKGSGSFSKYQTSIHNADLFAGFYFENWVIENEVLFRQGKSPEPSYSLLGGVLSRIDGSSNTSIVSQKLDTMAITGRIHYTISKEGALVGPVEYNQGNYTTHGLSLSYAYAPGDSDGFTPSSTRTGDGTVTGVALNRNYSPTKILFAARPGSENLRVDGIFDPSRLMNVTLLSLGYHYQSTANGRFSLSLSYASLNESMTQEQKDIEQSLDVRRVTFAGDDLGYELGLDYSKSLGRDFTYGINAAYAVAGDALKVIKDRTSPNAMHLEASLTIKL